MTSSHPDYWPDTDRGDDGGEWQQAHWAFVVIGGLRNLRGLVIPIAFVAVTQGIRGAAQDFIWLIVAVIVAAFSLGGSLVEWWNYRYRVTSRQIELRSGILSKNERVIPFERIQAVNITEAPLERLFHVVRMQVDTGAGGSAGAEIELRSLEASTAASLRAQLLAGRQRLRDGDDTGALDGGEAGAVEPLVTIDDGVVLRRLTTRDLLIAGATSGRIGAAAAIAGLLAQFGQEMVPRSMWERVPWDGLADAARSIQVVSATLLVLGILAWAISIVSTVLTYGGFEVRQADNQLFLHYGLLDRRRVTVPVRRIQAIRVVETLMRQPFGYAEVLFDLAGQGEDSGGKGTLFPILPKREVHALLAAACPAFAADLEPAGLRRLPGRARRRYIVAALMGWVVLVVVLAVVTWLFLDIPGWWVPSALLATPVFALFGNLRFRDAGWLVEGGRFLIRWRGVARVTAITQVRRLQFREVTADPFQRRANLATFRTAVASGSGGDGFSLPHLDRDEAESLASVLGRRRPPVPPVDARSGTARTA